MSYGSVRKRLAEQREQAPEFDPRRCVAHGCPCRASCSRDGVSFTCSAHDSAKADEWPRVTEALIEHKWLIELIDEIKSMGDKRADWRGFATQFWSEDEVCRPHARESVEAYVLRMRSELLHRCGLMKRPAVRLPREVKPGGIGRRLFGASA